MKKEVIIALIVIVMLLVLMGIWQFNSLKSFSNSDSASGTKECVKDEDCVKVQVGCCSCNSGGEEKCVSKNEAERYAKEIKNCSKDLFCAQVYNCVIEKCSCQEGKCQI